MRLSEGLVRSIFAGPMDSSYVCALIDTWFWMRWDEHIVLIVVPTRHVSGECYVSHAEHRGAGCRVQSAGQYDNISAYRLKLFVYSMQFVQCRMYCTSYDKLWSTYS